MTGWRDNSTTSHVDLADDKWAVEGGRAGGSARMASWPTIEEGERGEGTRALVGALCIFGKRREARVADE